MSKVSIIIPTYNRKKLLIRALRSILAQTYKNYEIIIYDDGSTDGTEAEIGQFNKTVVYLKGEHSGVSHARNEALRVSKGEYIAFLDDDDWWDEKYLETTVKRLKREDVIGVFTNYYKVYENGKKTIGFPKGKVPEIVDLNWMVRGSFIDPSFTVLKRDTVIKAGLFDETLSTTEDWDLWLRILKLGNFAYIDTPLVFKSATTNPSIPYDRWKNNTLVIDKFIKNLTDKEKQKLYPNLQSSAAKIYSRWGTYLLHTGKTTEARENLRKSLRMKFKFKTLFRIALTYLPSTVAKIFDGIYLREMKEHAKVRKLKKGR